MTRFTIDITDPAQLAGIKAAREAFNAALPVVKDEDGDVIEHDDYMSTDAEYIQYVMYNAANSYAKSHGVTDEAIDEAEVKLVEMKARRGQ